MNPLFTRFAALFAAAMVNARTDAIRTVPAANMPDGRRVAQRRKVRKTRVEPKLLRNYQAQYKGQFSGYFAQQNLKRKAQHLPMVAA